MDWFETLTGFQEGSWEETKSQLEIRGDRLHSKVNGKSYGICEFKLISLRQLREQVADLAPDTGRISVSAISADVRDLHRDPGNAGALFQVASQFNMLEMINAGVTPEQGVTRYKDDPTQGPACAISAGAGTIYRNYFVPVGNETGQTAARQLNGLSQIGAALSSALNVPVSELWEMKNGYCLVTPAGMRMISDYIVGMTSDAREELCAEICLGLHLDVDVTSRSSTGMTVSQIYCSALPLRYMDRAASSYGECFAKLILDAAYEATFLSGALNAARTGNRTVFLTLLGGGAFENNQNWIISAIERSIERVMIRNLDIRIVCHSRIDNEIHALVRRISQSMR